MLMFNEVKEEVEASFTQEELSEFKNFDDFFNEVDIQNHYEEEWKTWLAKGIRETYRKVYFSLVVGI